MASEELENSLRTEVEGYVNARLSGMLEELSRLQSQTNEMFTRFMERLGADIQSDAPVYAAISEHLRAAHKRGIEAAAAESSGAKASSEMAILKAAVEEVNEQQTQAGILNALVNRAVSFAPRVAFFVVKNDHAIGWRARGLEGSVGDDAVRDIAFPLSTKTLLSDAVELRATWSGEPGANTEDKLLLSKLGDESPQRMVGVPLIARNKAAAVLYADSANLGPEAINLEALETLVRVAGMAVELLASKRAPVQPAVTATAPATRTAEQSPAPVVASSPATKTSPAPVPEKVVSAPLKTKTPPAAIEEVSAPPPPPMPVERPKPVTGPLPASKPEVATNADENGATAPAWIEPTTHAAVPEETIAAKPEVAAVSPSVSSPLPSAPPAVVAPSEGTPSVVTAPLGTARQYGRAAEVELPIEVGEGEKRLHIDARRFARLLVSEIKLYNEEKVQKGRHEGDLYERLREEIDRSRMMYEKRVSPSVASRYDYFHHELINTLAEGNQDKLGRGYPGASVHS